MKFVIRSHLVEMMGIEPMSKFETQKIFYKFSLFVFEQLSSRK